MAKNTGGPAFPHVPSQYSQGDQGMTLRDWFAGKLLTGLAANCAVIDGELERDLAKVAYEQADAMLAERDK